MPLSPEGVAATHTAAYAAVSRAFTRHATLPGAERELLLVALLITAFLGWRTARRLGVPDRGSAVGLLALAAALLVVPLAAVATPAALAVPWVALAGYLATLRRSPLVAFGLAVVALVPAVLLAPDLLLAVVGGLGAAVAVWSWRTGGRVAGAGVAIATVLALAAVRLALPEWDAGGTGTAGWGGSTAALVVLGVVLLVVAVATAVFLPAFRPAAAGLLALTAFAVLPPSERVSALLLALPLAAFLVAALAGTATAPRERLARATRPTARRPVVLAAGAALAVLVVLAGVALATAPRDDFGARRDRSLLAWADAQLPVGATLDADPALAAELQQAGAPDGLMRGGDGQAPDGDAPVLQVVPGGDPEAPAAVASFTDGDGRPLTVVDPAATPPDAAALDRRRRLGAALLASPRTQLPEGAVGQLRDGAVDPRLLTLLAGIVARFDVRLADLPHRTGRGGGPGGALGPADRTGRGPAHRGDAGVRRPPDLARGPAAPAGTRGRRPDR